MDFDSGRVSALEERKVGASMCIRKKIRINKKEMLDRRKAGKEKQQASKIRHPLSFPSLPFIFTTIIICIIILTKTRSESRSYYRIPHPR